MSVRLHLFGPPQIEYDGATSALPLERRSQLLALLALKRSWVGRAELAALFWPELENRLAYANVRKTLFRFQSFPWASRLELQGGAARFEAETDVHAFELALREQRFADALRLRRGELLAGFDDGQSEAWSSWLSFERDRLRAEWRGAVLQRLAAPELPPAEGIDLSAQLLADDPLDETALRAHVSALARNGQNPRAHQAYRDFEARLATELGLEPGSDLRVLRDALGTTAGTPAPAASSAGAANDDGFVGRSLELRRIAELLAQQDCRLLSLIGPGGVGKSRLARRALQTLGPGFPHGAAFVPLEDIASPREIGTQLARELGTDHAAGTEPLEAVIEWLRERRTLLVLDNFEHVAGGASMLVQLLQACAGLKVIVTSRVRLAVAPEWLLPIEGLPCPEPEDADRAESFDAVRLFILSARRVQPALAPSTEIAAIVDICRQVDGLPLALELAAAWTRMLSCDAIAAELRDRGADLLRAAGTAHPARHASIEAVFDQSWQLLSEVERSVLARLAVFRGGFTAEAARAVAGASLPVLAALADKSLVHKREARIFLHPLVHQLAGLRLSDNDAARESTERAHALHFHRLLAQLHRKVESGERAALEQVEAEFDNCRSAWHWAVRHEASDALTRSTPTLLEFVDHRGGLEQALTLLREAAAMSMARGDSTSMATLGGATAHIEYRLDRHGDAEATALRALAAARAVHDHGAQAVCLNVLGSCALRGGRPADAGRFFALARRRALASANPNQIAALLDNQSLAEKAMGRYDEALRLSLQSLVQHRGLGDAAGEALCLNNLGVLYMAKDEWDSARVNLQVGLAISDRHGIVASRALTLANLTQIALATGDLEAAETFGRRALDAAHTAGNRSLESYLGLRFVRLALDRNDLPQARVHLRDALAIAIAIRRQPLQLAAVSDFGDLLAAQGEIRCARMVWTFAAEHPSLSAPERAEIRARLAKWPAESSAEPAWPGLELDELVHRIVAEAAESHAALIARLRGEP